MANKILVEKSVEQESGYRPSKIDKKPWIFGIILFIVILGILLVSSMYSHNPSDGNDGEDDNQQIAQNKTPIANAGIDQIVYSNTTVFFTGIGSDVDGTIIKYEWDYKGLGIFNWSSNSTGSTTHIYDAPGTYNAVLRVTDNNGTKDTDSCFITVGNRVTYEIGETANLTVYSATVKSVQNSTFYVWYGTSGTAYIEYATYGKKFITLDVEVVYLGTTSDFMYAGDFKLVDSQNIVYEYDLGTYSVLGGFQGVTLYQNQKAGGQIIFEIPENATGLNVQFNFGSSYNPIIVNWTIPFDN